MGLMASVGLTTHLEGRQLLTPVSREAGSSRLGICSAMQWGTKIKAKKKGVGWSCLQASMLVPDLLLDWAYVRGSLQFPSPLLSLLPHFSPSMPQDARVSHCFLFCSSLFFFPPTCLLISLFVFFFLWIPCFFAETGLFHGDWLNSWFLWKSWNHKFGKSLSMISDNHLPSNTLILVSRINIL